MEKKYLKIEEEEKQKERVVTQKLIKSNIKKYMHSKGMNIIFLSKETQISICKLYFLLYCPFSKIKLTNSFAICKALNLQLPKLLE